VFWIGFGCGVFTTCLTVAWGGSAWCWYKGGETDDSVLVGSCTRGRRMTAKTAGRKVAASTVGAIAALLALAPKSLTPGGKKAWLSEYQRTHPPNTYNCKCGGHFQMPQRRHKDIVAYCNRCGRLQRRDDGEER